MTYGDGTTITRARTKASILDAASEESLIPIWIAPCNQTTAPPRYMVVDYDPQPNIGAVDVIDLPNSNYQDIDWQARQYTIRDGNSGVLTIDWANNMPPVFFHSQALATAYAERRTAWRDAVGK